MYTTSIQNPSIILGFRVQGLGQGSAFTKNFEEVNCEREREQEELYLVNVNVNVNIHVV